MIDEIAGCVRRLSGGGACHIYRNTIHFKGIISMDFMRGDLPASLPMAAKKTVVTQAEYETLAGFRQTLRQFLRFSEDAALAAGVTPQQHQALLVIRGSPGATPVTIADFASRLQIRHHSAVGLADRLVKKKLVKRNQRDEDRRQIQAPASPRGGKKALEKLSCRPQGATPAPPSDSRIIRFPASVIGGSDDCSAMGDQNSPCSKRESSLIS